MVVLRKRRDIIVQLLASAFAMSPFAARLACGEPSAVDVKKKGPAGNTSTSTSAGDQKKNNAPADHRINIKRVALDFMDRAFNKGNVEQVDAAKDRTQAQKEAAELSYILAILNSIVLGAPTSTAPASTLTLTLPDFIQKWRQMLPDFKLNPKVVGVKGNVVSVGWSGTGTHTGEVDGIRPTKRRIHLSGVAVLAVVDGRVVGIRIGVDEGQLRTQFGGKRTSKDLKAKVRKPACEPPLCGETVQSPPSGRAIAKPSSPPTGRPSVLRSGLLDDKPGFSSQGPSGMGAAAPRSPAPSAPIGIR